MDSRARLSLKLAVRMALARLPWRLLKGSEKGARDRLETEYRLDAAAEKVVQSIEAGNYEVKLTKTTPPHSS